MLFRVRFGKTDAKMLNPRGILLLSPCQMDILLRLTFSTKSTLVRQLSAVSVSCFFNEIF